MSSKGRCTLAWSVQTSDRMYLSCPRSCSTKIVKNGLTPYGKQNYRCKDCDRQFVLDNRHLMQQQVRELIAKALLERKSLRRAIYRILSVSLTWLQAFTHSLWNQVPKRLGLNKKMAKLIKKMQAHQSAYALYRKIPKRLRSCTFEINVEKSNLPNLSNPFATNLTTSIPLVRLPKVVHHYPINLLIFRALAEYHPPNIATGIGTHLIDFPS